MSTDISPRRRSVIRRAASTALALALCVGCGSLAACAPRSSDSSETGSPSASENDGGLAPLTESIYYQGDAEPANEPYAEGAEPSDSETAENSAVASTGGAPDVDAILARCAGSCHDVAELNAYSGTADEVRREMDSMAGYIDPELTDDEIAALVERFGS